MIADAPAIMLLPGLDGTGDLFAAFADALRPDFDVRIIRYPVARKRSYTELVDYAEAEIPHDRPCVLLGESFSGPIAIHLAARGVLPVAGVVLCVTFARYPIPGLAKLDWALDVLPVAAIRQSRLFRHLMRRHISEKLLHDIDQTTAKVVPEVMLARMREVARMDATEPLRKIKAPLLYLRARHDNVVPAAAAHYIRRCRSDVQIVDFPCSHFLLQTMPQEAAEAMRQFISRLPENRIP